MHFEVEHVFDAPVEAVEAAMFHPGYVSFLLATGDLLTGHALQWLEDDGSQIRRRVQLSPRPAFDRIGSKRVPPEWFEFIEESTWDRRDRKLSFENIPTTVKIANRVINRGELTLEVVAPGKTRRRACGEIRLRDLPLLARPLAPMIEQMLAREAKRMFEAEARVLEAWLAQQRGAPPRPLAQA